MQNQDVVLLLYRASCIPLQWHDHVLLLYQVSLVYISSNSTTMCFCMCLKQTNTLNGTNDVSLDVWKIPIILTINDSIYFKSIQIKSLLFQPCTLNWQKKCKTCTKLKMSYLVFYVNLDLHKTDWKEEN